MGEETIDGSEKLFDSFTEKDIKKYYEEHITTITTFAHCVYELFDSIKSDSKSRAASPGINLAYIGINGGMGIFALAILMVRRIVVQESTEQEQKMLAAELIIEREAMITSSVSMLYEEFMAGDGSDEEIKSSLINNSIELIVRCCLTIDHEK